MLRTLAIACLLALVAPGPASQAFTIVPAEDAPGGYVVVVEADLGDRVDVSALPPAFQNLAGPAWRRGLSFRWRHFRSSESGEALLALDDTGRPVLAVEFAGDDLADGDTLAVAIGLTDRDGNALHTLFVAATVAGETFATGSNVHRTRVELDFDPGRWGQVGGFIVFTMKYYAIQKLDGGGVAKAMRRAVEREAGGGSQQWLIAG